MHPHLPKYLVRRPSSLRGTLQSGMPNSAPISFVPPGITRSTMSTASANNSMSPIPPADPSTSPTSLTTPKTPPLPASNMLSFLHLLQNLKTTKRTGWLHHNIPNPESISDHMYRMALFTFILPHHNRDKLLKLCLAHDLAESLVGDITPHDGITKEEKQRREESAMVHIRDAVLAGSAGGHELYDLWREYEDGVSEEAVIVKQIDKLEMIVQAGEYERSHGVSLEDFFKGTKGVFTDDTMVQLDGLIRSERNASP